MEENHFYDDLFNQQQNGKVKPKNRFVKNYGDQRFLPYLRIPVEYAVISGIVILLLVVISYAVGVERGKSIVISKDLVSKGVFNKIVGLPSEEVDIKQELGKEGQEKLTAGLDGNKPDEKTIDENIGTTGVVSVGQTVDIAETKVSADKTVVPEEVDKAAENEQVDIQQKVENVKKTVADIAKKSYTVRLITYAKQGRAVEEAEKLKAAGYDADLMRVGKWFQVYAGGYASVVEAKKAQIKLRKRYPDCYIREQK